MRTQIKINGELKDVEIENGEINIIEQKKNLTGWDFSTRPYYITAAGVTGGKELNYDGMAKIYETANAFSNEELAESINRMQTLQRQIFRWQAENDVPIELHPDCQKWTIVDDYEFGIKIVDYYKTGYGFMPVFSSLEKAEDCVKTFKNELIWLFAEFKWRMDG